MSGHPAVMMVVGFDGVHSNEFKSNKELLICM